MEIKGIDVSAWQGKIDWKKVADYGMGFAILRITETGNIVDKYFEANLTGCNKHKIPVGVYKYSYAMTIAEWPEDSVSGIPRSGTSQPANTRSREYSQDGGCLPEDHRGSRVQIRNLL